MFRFRKRKPDTTKAEGPGQTVNLDAVIASLGSSLGFWSGWTGTAEGLLLVRAKLADMMRDANVCPLAEAPFRKEAGELSLEGVQRLGLMTDVLQLMSLAQKTKVDQYSGAQGFLKALTDLASQVPLLTCEVLQSSDVRLEEFSRHLCACLQLEIEGEAAEASAARLHQINFGRLVEEAMRAKESAEDRLDYLRKLQETEEETRRPRRGKW